VASTQHGPEEPEKDPETPTGGGEPLRVFTEEALARLRTRDEPPTAAEAELAGPWRVRQIARGAFGVYRRGDEEAGDPPIGVFAGWHLALLVAAALPGLGRAAVFRVHPERGEEGYPLLREGTEVGALDPFLADLAAALDALEALVRSPTALALVLEAAGPTALERAGRELGLRLVAAPTPGEEP
jgi:hypothetical protein